MLITHPDPGLYTYAIMVRDAAGERDSSAIDVEIKDNTNIEIMISDQSGPLPSEDILILIAPS